jgi:phosphatidate cytidylyltransferase
MYPLAVSEGGNASAKGLPTLLGGVWSGALVLGGELAATPYDFAKATITICVAGCIVGGLWMIAAWRGKRPVATVAWLCLTPMYIGGSLAGAVALRGLEQVSSDAVVSPLLAGASIGLWWLLLAILGVYAADTAAYFVGRQVGRHRMAPSISPGKTWEGAAGGLAGAVIAAVALGLLFQVGAAIWHLAGIGVILGCVSPAGDLLESKIKRLANVKDSGNLFPGHGGMLDRLDSLLPSLTVLYILVAVSTVIP